MSSAGIPLCLLFAVAVTASGVRVKTTVDQKTNAGPHKCTIQWRWTRPQTGDTPQEEQTARVSFGVRSCRINCLATSTDYHYDKMFAKAFIPEEQERFCSCKEKDGGNEVIQFVGLCGEEKEAKKKCFLDYKVLSTDSLTKQWDKDTLKIDHNPGLSHERMFKYDEIKCEENACSGDHECFGSLLPSIMSGRTAEERKLIGDLLQKIAKGEIVEKQLPADMQALVGALTNEDKEAILFQEFLPEQYAAGPITVGVLKAAYEEKLQDTGVSVPHLLEVAGLTDMDEVLTYESFDRFLKPAC